MRKIRSRSIAALVSGTAIIAGIGTATAAPASAAATQCYRASIGRTMTKIALPIMDSGATYRWCSLNGRITTFVVADAHTVVRNWVWASDPRQDTQPTMSLGQDHLHIYADFSVKSTLSGSAKYKRGGGEIKVSWSPGRIGDHYEIDLGPNGSFTGTAWKG